MRVGGKGGGIYPCLECRLFCLKTNSITQQPFTTYISISCSYIVEKLTPADEACFERYVFFSFSASCQSSRYPYSKISPKIYG